MLLEQDIETSGLPAFVFPVIERAQNDLSVLVYRGMSVCNFGLMMSDGAGLTSRMEETMRRAPTDNQA